jgi:hypothetical protein
MPTLYIKIDHAPLNPAQSMLNLCLIYATSNLADALVKGSYEQRAIKRCEPRFAPNIGLHGQEPRSDLVKQH